MGTLGFPLLAIFHFESKAKTMDDKAEQKEKISDDEKDPVPKDSAPQDTKGKNKKNNKQRPAAKMCMVTSGKDGYDLVRPKRKDNC